MILAYRIPGMTEKTYNATVAAQRAQQHAAAVELPERLLVRRLERLGYAVQIERIAA